MDASSSVECITLTGEKIQISRKDLSFRIAVYGVILHEGSILLLKGRTSGKLWFPGGGVDAGDTLQESLHRELFEETGITVEVRHFLTFHEEFFYHNIWHKAFHSLRFYYVCKATTVEVVPDEKVKDGESQQPRWIDIQTLTQDSFDQAHGFLLLETALKTLL